MRGLPAQLRSTWRALPAIDRRNIILIVAIGGLVRFYLLLTYPPVVRADSGSYLRVAHAIAAFSLNGLPGYRTPGYPFVLLLAGYSPTVAWGYQCLMGLGTALLLYWLIRTFGGSSRWALLGGLFYALSVTVMAEERQAMTETLASLLITASVALTIIMIRRGRVGGRPAAALAAVLGYLCITRSEMLVVALCSFVALALMSWGLWQGPGRRIRSLLRPALVALLLPVTLLLSWAEVNKMTTGVFSVSGVLGHNLIDLMTSQITVWPGDGAAHAITVAYISTRRELSHLRWEQILARRDEAIKQTVATKHLPRRTYLQRVRTFELRVLKLMHNLHPPPGQAVSWVAEKQMQLASGLGAPRVSGWLQSIAIHTILHHPWAYISASMAQWPDFWIEPLYRGFSGAPGSGLIRTVGRFERRLKNLMGVWFLTVCGLGLLLPPLRRRLKLSWLMYYAGLVAVAGSLTACLLAPYATHRYGYVYEPLWLAIGFVALANVDAARVARRLGWALGALGSHRWRSRRAVTAK